MVGCLPSLLLEKEEQYQCVSMDVYCICRGSDTGEVMVACDKCKMWYCAECVKNCLDNLKKNSWLCSGCNSL